MAGPTLLDVAKRANVSKSTVSLVLNESPRIPPQTAGRVWDAVRELNYVPSRTARALQSGHSRLLGLLVSDITNPYFSELIRAVSDVATAAQYDLVTLDTNYDPSILVAQLEHLRTHRIDGLLIFTTERDLAILPKLAAAKLPAVLLNWGAVGPHVGDLVVQYDSGIAALLDHLIALGHRRLAVVTGPTTYFSAAERAKAFARQLHLRRDLLAPALYMQSDFRLGAAADTALVDQILALDTRQRPTAVLASNDLMAISLLRAFFSRGVAVPQEISVTGIDDIVFSNYTTPSLTTLRLPRRQMGSCAFELLQRLMTSDVVPPPTRPAVELRLILRESTGPAQA